MKKMKMNALLSLACASVLAAGVGVVALNTVETVNAETTHTEAIFMADGASIRYSAPSGIRFIGYVDEDVYTANSVVGMKITVGGVEKVFSTENIDGAEWQWATSDVEGYKKFQVAITQIPDTQYATEMTAQAYVDDKVSAETVTRSIANVANAALAADALLDETDKNKLDDTKVSALEGYTSGETALNAVSVKVLDNVASWTAVENAVGYLVKTDDDKPVKTAGTSYSVAGKSNVSVIAYGDGIDYTYSSVTEKTVHALGELELANFNDESYIADLEAGNSDFLNYDFAAAEPNKSDLSWHTAEASRKFYQYNATSMTEAVPVINTAKEGVDGGAADFALCVTGYAAGGTRFSVFSVNLQKSLNFDYSGIKVRLMLGGYGGTTAATATAYNLRLADAVPDKTSDNALRWYGYRTENADYPFKGTTKVLATTDFGTWIDWYITSEEMKVFYNAGDSKLVFTLEHAASLTAQNVIQANILIDDISYYDNSAIIASQLEADQLANFNIKEYEGTVATLPSGQQGSVGSSKVASVTYLDETACAGSNGGAVDIVLKWNNGDRKADFKVTFANKIDATNYDGIEVRFKVYDTSLWSNIENTPMYFKMINASGSVYGSATQSSYPAFIKTVTAVGEWLTVRFDSTTVGKCIVDEGYALSFQLIVHNPNTPEINGTGGIYLDDISYYKEGES